MTNPLRTKHQHLILSITGTVYTTLILVLTSLMFASIIPMLQQPIPLHDLATLKTNTAVIEPIIISIHENGAYSLNTVMQPEATMSLQSIKQLLNKQFKIIDRREISLCIKADPSVPYSQVAQVVDWAEKVGVQHVGLLTLESGKSL